MPEFIADTDGTVCHLKWDDLADFTKGYIECMLFTETSSIPMVEFHTEESQELIREGQADGDIPNDAGFGDIHPNSFADMQMDCVNFEHQAHDLLLKAWRRGYDRMQAGRDFWFTRNGHGVGFWDRAILREDGLGDALSDIAKGFGQVDAYFSEGPDDASPTGYGFVYIH